MKTAVRFFTLFLMILICVAAFPSFAEVSEDNSSIISSPIDVMNEVGLTYGNAPTMHGNHQTRLVTVSHGTYFALIYGDQKLDEKLSQPIYSVALIKKENDGMVSLLGSFEIMGVSASPCIMADSQERIYVASAGEADNGYYKSYLWRYDDTTQTVTDLTYRGFYRKNAGYGYPVGLIDLKYNRIYVISVGGDVSGQLTWNVFDIESETWSGVLSKKVAARYCYQFAYPDGNGGFFMLDERDVRNFSVYSNLGNRVSEDMNTYHSRKLDADYMWDEPHLLHVPDATKAEVIDQVVESAVYDVQNGCYPNCTNSENDSLLLDNGLFYSVITLNDNGTPRDRKYLYIYDANQTNENGEYTLVLKKEITFLYGESECYNQKLYMDTKGNLYIIALNQCGSVEIWKGEGEYLADFKLIYECEDTWEGVSGATICATNRSGSVLSDVVNLITWNGETWWYYTIDLSQLNDK